MRQEERKARAYAAKALMDDPTLNEAWKHIEDELIAEWAKPAPWEDDRAKAKRDRIWIELQTLRSFRQRLATFAAQGRD